MKKTLLAAKKKKKTIANYPNTPGISIIVNFFYNIQINMPHKKKKNLYNRTCDCKEK